MKTSQIDRVRLSSQEIELIKAQIPKVTPQPYNLRLFGSRVDSEIRGGDIDLMLELKGICENPVVMRSRLAALVSIALGGRKVDVVIKADNTKALPIHSVALAEGVIL